MYYGDLGKRAVAFVIDLIILSVIGLILGATLSYVGVIIAPFAGLLYYILLEGGNWHATLGKRVMGLYVADGNGNGITYATAILRLIGRFFSGVLLGVGYLMAFFNDRKQGLHDMIAKTYVLNAERGVNGGASSVGGFDGNVGQPQLVAISGPLAGTVYQISERGLVIGRDSIGCQVVIPNYQAKVSRMHCYITFNPMSGMFVLNDRNSTHGTYLANGSRIPYAQPVALKSGDRFYLATPENTFEVR